MAWHEITELPNPVSALDLSYIIGNMQYIRDLLIEKDITVENLTSLTPFTAMFYCAMKAFYNSIESNFDKISDNEYQSAYYVEALTRGSYEPNRDEWQRWIDVLNDMYLMLNSEVGLWKYLLCTDGYPTIDGHKILCRGAIENG